MPMQVVDHLLVFPAKCFYCGTADPERGPWLDSGIPLDYGPDGQPYGVVFICTLCMTDIGDKMGYITPNKADELKTQVLQLTVENSELQEQVKNLQDAFISMTRIGFNGDNYSSGASDSGTLVFELEAEPEFPFNDGIVESGTEGFAESDSIEGLADLSDSESRDNPFDL